MAEIRLATRDPLFATAVEALAGAMGHSVVRQPERNESPGGLLVVDWPGVAGNGFLPLDPLTTIVFAPAKDVPAARAASGATVETRSALAVALPRFIAERLR